MVACRICRAHLPRQPLSAGPKTPALPRKIHDGHSNAEFFAQMQDAVWRYAVGLTSYCAKPRASATGEQDFVAPRASPGVNA